MSFVNMSSNFPLPCAKDDAEVFDDDDFFAMEKSCTSDRSIGFFIMSAIFTLGKL